MTKHLITVPLLVSLAFPATAQQTMDMHSHIIVPEYMEMLKEHGAELEETFPLPVWNAERHIAFMDSAGIRTAVLTMPAPQPYFGDAEESAVCIRRVNEISAEVKRRYPDRFRFCAARPAAHAIHPPGNGQAGLYAADRLGGQPVAPILRPGRQPDGGGHPLVTDRHPAGAHPLWVGLSLPAGFRTEGQSAKAETDTGIG